MFKVNNRIMSLVECCFLGLVTYKWLIMLSRDYCCYPLVTRCYPVFFMLCKFWATIGDDYYRYAIFRKKIFRICYHYHERVYLATDRYRKSWRYYSRLGLSTVFLLGEKYPSQLAFTCSKLTIETLEQGVKYV